MAKLTRDERKRARNLAAKAALLGYRNRGSIHYTQGQMRWSGISGHRDARLGQFPAYADCSAYATWCLWNGLFLPYEEPDCVNALFWRYGNTGSMIRQGRAIKWSGSMRKGDCVFYAYRGTTPTHVAIMVGRQPDHSKGTPMVVSHGSESGPLYLPYNYRRIVQVRRFVYDGV
jgi:hypothetical protein